MITLYGIVNGELHSVEASETKKMYKPVKFVSWLGYTSQISKDDSRVFLTPSEAISNAISNAQRSILALEHSLKKQKELLFILHGFVENSK